jgi:uncharacterized protein with PIN domain
VKFLADDMLGRLGKWLRILGYDTLSLPRTSDENILKKAIREKRILLTRDRELAEKATSKRSLFIVENRYQPQVREVIRKLRLKIKPKKFFNICLACNKPVKRIHKDRIKKLVPKTIYERNHYFWKCSKCKKIYWKGSHYTNTLKKLGFRG